MRVGQWAQNKQKKRWSVGLSAVLVMKETSRQYLLLGLLCGTLPPHLQYASILLFLCVCDGRASCGRLIAIPLPPQINQIQSEKFHVVKNHQDGDESQCQDGSMIGKSFLFLFFSTCARRQKRNNDTTQGSRNKYSTVMDLVHRHLCRWSL